MNEKLQKSIVTAELKKKMGIPQTGYTIGYRGLDGYCYTLADGLLDEVGRQHLYFLLKNALIAKAYLEKTFTSCEFCIFKLEELR